MVKRINFIFFVLLFGLSLFFAKSIFPNDALAQYCPPQNTCFCNGGQAGCCATEGAGGYNCGGGTGDSGGGGHPTNEYNCPAGTHPDFSDTTNSSYVCSNIYSGNRVQYVGCCAYFIHTEDCSRSTAQIAPCYPDCSATAPTTLTYNTATQTLSWSAGTGGVSQSLFVSTDLNQVNGNCLLGTSPGCIVNDNAAVSPYSLSGANFNVNNQINLTDGSGFFLVIVKGNIIVDPTLTGGTPDIEGLYVADGTFQSGLGVTQLTARGSVVAYGGLTLSRDLGDVDNTTTPAEVFEFAPDQIMLFPKVLSTRKINWKEVAP